MENRLYKPLDQIIGSCEYLYRDQPTSFGPNPSPLGMSSHGGWFTDGVFNFSFILK